MAISMEPRDVDIRSEALRYSILYLGASSGRSPKRAMEIAEYFATFLKTGEIT